MNCNMLRFFLSRGEQRVPEKQILFKTNFAHRKNISVLLKHILLELNKEAF